MLMKNSAQSLAEQLAVRFAQRIRDRLLAAGARLPSVRQCAQQQGVSPSTVVGAYDQLLAQGQLKQSPIRDHVAAISVGIVQGTPLLDLEYIEDSACDTDMNVVMTGSGHFVEVQGTAEGAAFSRREMDALLELAEKGISDLVALQKKALETE